ncbi:hypothetical protein, conserved [Eimeria tenella]|uniref:Homologous recombination OB-fold protein OB-fold domain-containing protein n=1 Tax=Eimeria tenella TaxID=5802 RepID=U6KP61_EIMTE|nr:hypothetical protein, conserved [Eimeria tenella]CDJ37238.1 hypothetical protein, conserved [Eimeria tenella]|eukprot:XP_013228076.1 hypothetical protein, conserved [Eimeria tenella]
MHAEGTPFSWQQQQKQPWQWSQQQAEQRSWHATGEQQEQRPIDTSQRTEGPGQSRWQQRCVYTGEDGYQQIQKDPSQQYFHQLGNETPHWQQQRLQQQQLLLQQQWQSECDDRQEAQLPPPKPWEPLSQARRRQWQQDLQQQQQSQLLLQQQWHEQQQPNSGPSEPSGSPSSSSPYQQQPPQLQQQQRNQSLSRWGPTTQASEWQQQQQRQQQQQQQWREQPQSENDDRQEPQLLPPKPWEPSNQARRRQWQRELEQQQQQSQQQQQDDRLKYGALEGHQTTAATPVPRTKRVWGLSRAAVAATKSPAAASSNWNPRAWPSTDPHAGDPGGDSSNVSNSSSCKREELSFEGVKAATAAAAVAAAVLQSAARQQPSVLMPPAAEPDLPGPAGRLLRRRQQQEKGKRIRGLAGDSPFALEKGHIRSADSSQSLSSAAAAVAAAAAAPGFTSCPGCWGGAWLGLRHCDTAQAAAAATTMNGWTDEANEQRAPLQHSASWVRAVLFLGFPFDAFHLGLTPSPSPCPRIMSFLVESNVSAVLRYCDSPVTKVPHLLLFLKYAIMGDDEGTLTDRLLVAADPTGEVVCSVHSSVSETFHLCPGSTVILQEPTVYYAAFKLPYVLITQRSLVRAFPPSFIDDGLRQQADEAREEWEYRVSPDLASQLHAKLPIWVGT